MPHRSRLLIQVLGALAALGCADSYGDTGGALEPIVVSNATFNAGSLPNDGLEKLPLTTSTSSGALAGGPEKSLSGRASLSAYAVAVGVKGAGSGYWVVPVGLPDLIDPGLDWSLKFRFTRQMPLGSQTVLVAQTDKRGRFSAPSEIPFTVKSLLPEGKKVISLVWHNHADLDLQVQGPDGKITSSKRPNTGVVPDDKKLPSGGIEGSGTLNRDSNARCAFDGIMEEDVVFDGDPAPGDYLVWVDLYDHCGEAATTFELQLHEDGVQTFGAVGQLLDINADNGTGAGLFMNTFSF
ncbi:MAG TPA: hypothetical protein VEQ59_22215 [Polyangiaceae bacterium]|nr:hypothetical protein [Polyangiaceae bacterium]